MDGLTVPPYLEGHVQEILGHTLTGVLERNSPYIMYGGMLELQEYSWMAFINGQEGKKVFVATGNCPADAIREFNKQWEMKGVGLNK